MDKRTLTYGLYINKIMNIISMKPITIGRKINFYFLSSNIDKDIPTFENPEGVLLIILILLTVVIAAGKFCVISKILLSKK